MHVGSKSIISALILILFAGPLHAGSFSGHVVRVLSGDTVEIQQDDGKLQPVRLAQVYAPVQGQPFGTAARHFLWRSAGEKNVSVRYDDYDLHGNAVGEVFLEDGTNLNKLVVASGYAWEYRGYKGYSYDAEYWKLEAAARRARIGLWEVKNPIQPWEWGWLQTKADSLRKSGELEAVCGAKKYCSQMADCEEAKFYMYACGLTRLDMNGDGVPCETKCEGEQYYPPLEASSETAGLLPPDRSGD